MTSTPTIPSGPGLFEVPSDDPFVLEHVNGDRYAFDNFRKLEGVHLEGTERAPGSVLIGWAAWLLAVLAAGLLFVSFDGQFRYIFEARHESVASLIESLMFDFGMIIFSLLALGLARAGKPARAERTLIMVCSAGSAAMNYAAADTASPRSVVAYVAAPVFLAVVVDRVIAVIRRHVLGDDEGSAWTALGAAVVAAARLAGMVLLYSLRTILAPRETSAGLRRMVLDAAPLPGNARNARINETPAIDPAPTKKAALLALYREHADYGNREVAAKVAAELAPAAGLQAGTARAYVYAELESRAS
jgi:hypothetical protein